MRAIRSQASVAIVCGILGFMVATQFRAFMKQDKLINTNPKNDTDITVEIEQLKKEKAELQKKVNDQDSKLKSYEASAASKSDSTKTILKELEETRILTGSTDVQGPGVVVYITPNSNLFGTAGGDRISAQYLVFLVNELRFAGAEAISINDIRLTGRSGIRDAGNYILINDGERVSPLKRITIKAIGDKALLNGTLDFQETTANFKGIAEVKYEKQDSIRINKFSKAISSQYAKPVQ